MEFRLINLNKTNPLKFFERVTSQRNYIREIDVLRFYSIFFVILCHAAVESSRLFHNLPTPLLRLCENGANGVRIFFVISGFIIAVPFIENIDNKINFIFIRKYFLRRIERLEPPFIISTTIIFFILIFYLKKNISIIHYFVTIFYQHQFIFQEPSIINSITWSLEIEIQFYVICPLVFWLLPKGLNKRIIAESFLLFSSLILNSLIHLRYYTLIQFFHYFTLGIILADLFKSGIIDKWYKNISYRYWWIIDLIFLTSTLTLDIRNGSTLNILFFLIASFYLFVLFLGNNDSKRKAFLRDSYILSLIGGMCYTIYLYHVLIVIPMLRVMAAFKIHPPFIVFLGFVFFIVVVASGVLFVLFEKPFMYKNWYRKLLPAYRLKPRPSQSE